MTKPEILLYDDNALIKVVFWETSLGLFCIANLDNTCSMKNRFLLFSTTEVWWLFCNQRESILINAPSKLLNNIWHFDGLKLDNFLDKLNCPDSAWLSQGEKKKNHHF